MFSRILVSGLFAGFAAGLIAALLQLVFVQPLLLQAELYESGQLTHFGAAKAAAAPAAAGGIDLMRDGLSVLFTTLIYTGYSLILVAAMALAEDRGSALRSGRVFYGASRFVSVQFAPAVGLPPELPGSAAADMDLRQLWWFGTVGATAAGIALIAFGKGWTARGIAAVLILAPHAIGAPLPETFAGPVPPELAGLFAGRALGVGLVAWVLLGCSPPGSGCARAGARRTRRERPEPGPGEAPSNDAKPKIADGSSPMPRSLALLLIGLSFGGGIGFFLAAANNVALDGHRHGPDTSRDSDHAAVAGHGGTIALPSGPDAPTLDFRVVRDAASGWNLHIVTTNFRFAPERANAPHRPGEGHAHVYVTEGRSPGSTGRGSISARCRRARPRLP